MKCHILFSGKNKKNVSKCRLLKILPRVLSVKHMVMHTEYGTRLTWFTSLWANSADCELIGFFFLYFSRKIGFDISCIFSP